MIGVALVVLVLAVAGDDQRRHSLGGVCANGHTLAHADADLHAHSGPDAHGVACATPPTYRGRPLGQSSWPGPTCTTCRRRPPSTRSCSTSRSTGDCGAGPGDFAVRCPPSLPSAAKPEASSRPSPITTKRLRSSSRVNGLKRAPCLMRHRSASPSATPPPSAPPASAEAQLAWAEGQQALADGERRRPPRYSKTPSRRPRPPSGWTAQAWVTAAGPA